jgi:uncharacterized phage-associated protein
VNPRVARSTPIDAKGLANLILSWAEVDHLPITPMKLQKLLFFIHADFLVRFGRSLLKQEFEAWDHGPVIPGVFQEFKRFSKNPITSRAWTFDPIDAVKKVATCSLPETEAEAVRAVYDFYKPLSATELSRMSHDLEGAWRQARSMFANGLNMDRRISDDMIVGFHRAIHN